MCMYISGMPDGGERLVELSVLKKQVQHFLRVLLHLYIYILLHLYICIVVVSRYVERYI
jgi:hypothetical protein